MKFLKNNISYNSNDLYLNNNCSLIYKFERKSFMSLKLFIQVFVACIYAFGLGYSLFYLDKTIENGLLFLVLLALSFFIVTILNEFLHVLFYPNKDSVTIRYSLLKLTLFSSSEAHISKRRSLLIAILPFTILAILPTISSCLLGFNLFLYALASAGAIKTSIGLLNMILIIKNVPENGYLKVYGYDFYMEDFESNDDKLDSNTNNLNI